MSAECAALKKRVKVLEDRDVMKEKILRKMTDLLKGNTEAIGSIARSLELIHSILKH